MEIKDLTAWNIVERGERTMLISSPFCMRDGGESISFYIHDIGNDNYIVSDEHFCITYADMYDVRLTPRRMKSMEEKSCVRFARFREDGAIYATANKKTLGFALIDAAKLALAVSYEIEDWLPKIVSDGFKETLKEALVKSIPKSKIITNFKAEGYSRTNIEIPFAIIFERKKYLIETVSKHSKDLFSWADVYKIYGKYSDIRMQNDRLYSRYVIFENMEDEKETRKAQTLLTEVSNTRIFSPDDQWDEIFAA